MIDNRQQWFFLIFISIWIVAATILPIVAFYRMGNPVWLSGFGALAPPSYILYRITKHLFPLSENDTKIALAKRHSKRGQRIRK